jgi:hypothetical protein
MKGVMPRRRRERWGKEEVRYITEHDCEEGLEKIDHHW